MFCLKSLRDSELAKIDENDLYKSPGSPGIPIHSPQDDHHVRPFSQTYSDSDLDAEFVYFPTPHVGYYEFQVFGVDTR